jgi:hypothetical protein
VPLVRSAAGIATVTFQVCKAKAGKPIELLEGSGPELNPSTARTDGGVGQGHGRTDGGVGLGHGKCKFSGGVAVVSCPSGLRALRWTPVMPNAAMASRSVYAKAFL